MSNLRDSIFGSDDLGEELVDIPEWGPIDPATGKHAGVTVKVIGMTAEQRNQVIQESQIPDPTKGEDGTKMDLDGYYSRIAQLCAIDPETGEQVFAPDDAPLLLKRNPAALDRITLVAMRLSGMDKKGLDAAIANAGKGSSSTASAAPSSK